ncbi:MAG TPA: universal stress protein [Thermodesulfobacteriota bacterium]|nr:universal stress protein [Thermodesulfobacteriota bacterium]
MIPQIKKILFATDLSKNSAYAFYYAVHLAKRDEAKIVVLHAVEPLPRMLVSFEDFEHKVAKDRWEDTVKKFKDRIQNISVKVDARMGISSVDLISSILIRPGHPVEEILKVAEEEGCDVIVLGTHGKGFLEQTFLGSVSNSVLLRTRKPVFIVPLPSKNTNMDLI